MPIQTKFNIRRKFSQTASETESSSSIRYFISLNEQNKNESDQGLKNKSLTVIYENQSVQSTEVKNEEEIQENEFSCQSNFISFDFKGLEDFEEAYQHVGTTNFFQKENNGFTNDTVCW